MDTKHYWILNIKAELLPKDGKSAQFRMNPRYKVKSVGESVRNLLIEYNENFNNKNKWKKVRPEDLVAFESVKSTGHYLHSTKENFDKTSVYIDK